MLRQEPGVQTDKVATEVVDACVAVHRELGAGLLESVYQVCLAEELRGRGMSVRCEVPLQVRYRGKQLDAGFRVDIWVENCVFVENKCIQSLLPIHEAQLLTYLRLSGITVGFLINWNVLLIKDGIKRMVFNR